MDETYSTKCIILNRESFRENDSRVAVYTESRGKLNLVARGTKKISSKLAGHIEPISLTDIMIIRGRRFDYIGGAASRDCYFNIKTDLERLKFAGAGIKVFNDLIKPEERDPGLFLLLNDYLHIINFSAAAKAELVYYFFIFYLLSSLGYKPELFSCLKCKRKIKPGQIYFDYAAGSAICSNCGKTKHSLTISGNSVKVLRFAHKNNINKSSTLNISISTKAEIVKLIRSFYEYNHS